MDSLNEAIKLAIEKGGYSYGTNMLEGAVAQRMGLIDPAFWQALGKALGKTHEFYAYDHPEPFMADSTLDGEAVHSWGQAHAHAWLDAHFEGQEAEDKFWQEILNPK